MSDASQKSKSRRPVRRQRSIYQVHYCLQQPKEEEMAKPLAPPSESQELQAYGQQVAGHQNTAADSNYNGLLQCGGKILKPILKEAQRREVALYERVWRAEPALAELRRHVPAYYGCRAFTYGGCRRDYIILEDLAHRMLEPCVMDVKIGRKTWGPDASPEKIERERSKYSACKEQLGFCIPGYQVYRLPGGRLRRHGKDWGKRLQPHMVRTAIKDFLNASDTGGVGGGGGVCRALVLQVVGALWALQRWAGRARSLRLRAASLLLVYDAARLRRCQDQHGPHFPLNSRPSTGIVRRKSIHSSDNPASGSFSGQLGAKGPTYKKVNSVPLAPLTSQAPPPITSPWTEALEKLNLSHSFEHNYEDKLSKIKMNYRAQLDQLSSDSPTPNPWGTVKLIDFTHAYFTDDPDPSVDENFKEGIDNFVAIFESLLSETDDQVF